LCSKPVTLSHKSSKLGRVEGEGWGDEVAEGRQLGREFARPPEAWAFRRRQVDDLEEERRSMTFGAVLVGEEGERGVWGDRCRSTSGGGTPAGHCNGG